MSLAEAWHPLGQALLDYHNGEKAASITVRSSVEHDRHVPLEVFYKTTLRFPDLEKKALKECRGKVLDIGAGSGAHSLWLEKKGLHVTAMDISPEAVEVMQKRGLKNRIASDFLALDSGQKFDTLLLMMNGIGICGNIAGVHPFLQKCKALLSHGGQIIFDSTDLSYVTDDMRAAAGLKPRAGYHGSVLYQLIYKGRESEPYEWLFIDQSAMRSAAWEQGFNMRIIAEKKEQYVAVLTLM
jgi:2-polyprenyl-3-methyl-5-hydroxy-6-metoxy-1,4-benzoquinol methylase